MFGVVFPNWSFPLDISTFFVLATLPSLDVTAQRKILHLALKVGEKLFNFMQSFCGVDGSRLVVPMDILDRWFKKFQERAQKDPEYLKGFVL